MFSPVIFREYDVRGVYLKEFDLVFAEQLARAFATFLVKNRGYKKLKLALGYDARLSSPDIQKAVSRGFQMAGAEVINLGMITSPISYFATFTIPECTGGIMITGSHNPPEYNGFKLSAGQSTIFGADIQLLKTIIDEQSYLPLQSGSESDFNIFPSYLERYKTEFFPLKQIPVVLDCGNGAAGVIVKDLFHTAGLEPIILFEKPDGTFPNHHPDPTVEKNMIYLKEAVLKHKALLGIGFDGDADRIGVIDETGKLLMGDELMILFSRAILEKNKGAKIIGDVKCSDRLYHDIEKRGGVPIMWKTGHSLIKEKIKSEKSPFGGEMSGHIFFADRNYGYDDALYAGLRVCEILSQTGKSITQILADVPVAYNTPEIRIDTTEEKKLSIVNKLISVYSKPSSDTQVNLLDGIRISFPDGWALARASNTQPVLVLRFESSTPEGLKAIETQIRSVVDPLL